MKLMGTDSVYLDNAATTAVLPDVVEEMKSYFTVHYGNPASTHEMGVTASRAVETAARALEKYVGSGHWDVIFTSSGTEANNFATLGYAQKYREGRIITTQIEHASVLEPCKFLSQRNYEIVRIAPGPGGMISSRELMKKIDHSTLLVSVQHANNEIGTLHPVEEIGINLKKLHPRVLFHIDAVQTAGKMDISGAVKWADFITLSAHKIHGPKGIGALMVKKEIKKPSAAIRGGGQQGGIRSGTENVPGMAGFALAMKIASDNLGGHANRMKEMEYVFNGTFKETESARRMFRDTPRLPGFIVVGFERIPSEVIEHSMEAEGFIVSSTAACSSRKVKRSHVLESLALPEETNVIRIVPSRFTTPSEMEGAASALNRIFRKLL